MRSISSFMETSMVAGVGEKAPGRSPPTQPGAVSYGVVAFGASLSIHHSMASA